MVRCIRPVCIPVRKQNLSPPKNNNNIHNLNNVILCLQATHALQVNGIASRWSCTTESVEQNGIFVFICCFLSFSNAFDWSDVGCGNSSSVEEGDERQGKNELDEKTARQLCTKTELHRI